MIKEVSSSEQSKGAEWIKRASDPEQYNNLACIHMKNRKYELASIYFQRAIDKERSNLFSDQKQGKLDSSLPRSAEVPATEEKGKSSAELKSHSVRRTHLIEFHYNQGMAHMKCSRPLEAFQCFETVLPVLHRMPYIWIRLAECCINFDQMSRVVPKYSDPSGFYETILPGTRSQRILLRFVLSVFGLQQFQ